MKCPFCNNDCVDNSYRFICQQKDHDFWYRLDGLLGHDWFIQHYSSGLFASENGIAHIIDNKPIFITKFDSPTLPVEGISYLNKIIKNKAFI